ncbi:MAG: hypothetical protein ACYC1M_19210 [Armatimonadota bacterium]
MTLSQQLDEYGRQVSVWLDQAKKATAAIQKFQKALTAGNLRDVEKLRQAALLATEALQQRAESCPEFNFDATGYLQPDGEFIPELKAAAEAAGVKMYERDGIIFCYPVLIRREPDIPAVRIDKQLNYGIRSEILAAQLKKLQAKDPKTNPERFMETIFEAYKLILAKPGRARDEFIDIPLTKVYEVLTMLPSSNKEYSLLDFTRDIYFLELSRLTETKEGYHMSLPASTASRERSAKKLRFVTRDGMEKEYVAIKFTLMRR